MHQMHCRHQSYLLVSTGCPSKGIIHLSSKSLIQRQIPGPRSCSKTPTEAKRCPLFQVFSLNAVFFSFSPLKSSQILHMPPQMPIPPPHTPATRPLLPHTQRQPTPTDLTLISLTRHIAARTPQHLTTRGQTIPTKALPPKLRACDAVALAVAVRHAAGCRDGADAEVCEGDPREDARGGAVGVAA